MLSDLKAEIKPHGILDLERVVPRSAIEDSKDLKHALKSRHLQMGRHSIVKTKSLAKGPQVIHTLEKTIEKERELDEDRLAELIRNVVKEERGSYIPEPAKQTQDISEVVQKAVSNSVSELINSIRDQIGTIQAQPNNTQQVINTPIDPAKFAEMSQKSISKISDDIETGGANKARKIKFRNDSIHDLADEI